MTQSESRRRLWHDLGLGPLWRERAPAGDQDAGAAACADTGADTGADVRAHPPQVAAAATQPVGALDWEGLEEAVAQCTACGLCRTRKQTVFAAGCQSAHWMFIGEAPGAEEDARGEPFVGQAGRLLDGMLDAIGLSREASGAGAGLQPAAESGGVTAGPEPVYIANVIKCRPPGNRNPQPEEVAACKPFLQRQIELLQPRIIVLMGRIATQALLATDESIASLRGRLHQLVLGQQSYPAIVTYHPAYLLRSLADKAKSWDDLCLARDTYERLAPAPSTGSPVG